MSTEEIGRPKMTARLTIKCHSGQFMLVPKKFVCPTPFTATVLFCGHSACPCLPLMLEKENDLIQQPSHV
jgi:hypothetical protein